MSIAFPTGHTHPGFCQGTPGHARPCQCGARQIIDPDTGWCMWCSKYPKATINETFAERARVIQMRGSARKLKRAA